MRTKALPITALAVLLLGSSTSEVADAASANNKPASTVTTLKARSIVKINPLLHEVSGLAKLKGRYWGINDNGGKAALYGFDEKTLSLKNTIALEGATNIDWEDLAQDAEHLYVADIGNNFALRSSISIYKVASDQLKTDQVNSTVESSVIKVQYADKTSFFPKKKHNFDSEALTVVGDQLWLFSKNRQDLRTKLYKIDKSKQSQSLNPVASFDVQGLITAADYNPETAQLLLLGYSHKSAFGRSFIWQVDVSQGLPQWSTAKRYKIEPFAQWESVKWLSDDEFMIAAEQSGLTSQQVATFTMP
jgi:hypothetical protein